MGTAIPRTDEVDRFVVLSSGESCVWRMSSGFLWHATVDGLRSVCSKHIVLTDGDPYASTVDRSDDTMTCRRCQERVRRIREPRSL
jgi:hypothetical protein